MALFSRNKKPQAPAGADAAALLALREERLAFVEQLSRTLLLFLKDATLGIAEIDTAAFISQLDELTQRLLQPDEPVRALQTELRKRQPQIADFIARQKSYLRDRETELRDIIDLLSKAMASLTSENRRYNDTIYSQTEKMEAITRLDDIKRIKEAIKEEVSQIRATVRTKVEQDSQQVEQLSRQVTVLRGELEKTRQETLIDGLTGVYNRRAFDMHLRECIERSAVMAFSFSLLLIDIDDFKPINDTYGHLTGDRVLVSLIHKCQQFIRSEDMTARYGGEEFAIILPGASLRNAVKKARTIRKAVAATRYRTGEETGDQTLAVTVSIGVAAVGKADSAAALIERADRALYQAKRQGKNRVVSEKELR
jgi:diguanylate cyclase